MESVWWYDVFAFSKPRMAWTLYSSLSPCPQTRLQQWMTSKQPQVDAAVGVNISDVAFSQEWYFTIHFNHFLLSLALLTQMLFPRRHHQIIDQFLCPYSNILHIPSTIIFPQKIKHNFAWKTSWTCMYKSRGLNYRIATSVYHQRRYQKGSHATWLSACHVMLR